MNANKRFIWSLIFKFTGLKFTNSTSLFWIWVYAGIYNFVIYNDIDIKYVKCKIQCNFVIFIPLTLLVRIIKKEAI